MKKIITILLLCSYLFAGIDGNEKLDTSTLDKIPVSEILKSLSNSVSKSFPMIMDEVTTATRVYSNNKTLIYQKQVDSTNTQVKDIFKSDNLILKFKKILYEADKNTVCYNYLFKYLLERGATVEYNWINEKSIPLFDYTVNNNDCNISQ